MAWLLSRFWMVALLWTRCTRSPGLPLQEEAEGRCRRWSRNRFMRVKSRTLRSPCTTSCARGPGGLVRTAAAEAEGRPQSQAAGAGTTTASSRSWVATGKTQAHHLQPQEASRTWARRAAIARKISRYLARLGRVRRAGWKAGGREHEGDPGEVAAELLQGDLAPARGRVDQDGAARLHPLQDHEVVEVPVQDGGQGQAWAAGPLGPDPLGLQPVATRRAQRAARASAPSRDTPQAWRSSASGRGGRGRPGPWPGWRPRTRSSPSGG